MDRLRSVVEKGYTVKIELRNKKYNGKVIDQDLSILFDGRTLDELVEEMKYAPLMFEHNKKPIEVAGHKGTWHCIGAKRYGVTVILQLEHDRYGEEANGLFVTEEYKVVFVDEGNNGIEEFEAFLDATECEECGKTLRELLENGTAYEFINGEDLMCIDCQAELTSN